MTRLFQKKVYNKYAHGFTSIKKANLGPGEILNTMTGIGALIKKRITLNLSRVTWI